MLVARQHRHVPVIVVARLGQSAAFCLGKNHVAIAGIFPVRVHATELEVWLTLRRRQIEETRSGSCCIAGYHPRRATVAVVTVADVVERRRIDYYVGRGCVRLGIGDLRPYRALIRIRRGLRLAGRWRRRPRVVQLALGDLCGERKLVTSTLIMESLGVIVEDRRNLPRYQIIPRDVKCSVMLQCNQ